MIAGINEHNMDMQRFLLTLLGATVSLILAMLLIRYSKRSMVRTMLQRHILHMLKSRGMSAAEISDAVKQCRSAILPPKLVPVVLSKLQNEGLVQIAASSRYVITSKGLESLRVLDSVSREFQRVAKIVQKTSSISKFMAAQAIDSIAMFSDADYLPSQKRDEKEDEDTQQEAVPVYGADKE